MRLTSLQHALLIAVLTLFFTVCTFPATLTIPHIGGPVSITAMYGGQSESSVQTPDWFKLKSHFSTFADGWQKVILTGEVKTTETPRAGVIEVNFATGTIHKFAIEQAGKLDIGFSDDGTISLPFKADEIVTIWLREPDKPDAIPIADTKALRNRRGWLFVKTRTGLYSSWISDQTNARLFSISKSAN